MSLISLLQSFCFLSSHVEDLEVVQSILFNPSRKEILHKIGNFGLPVNWWISIRQQTVLLSASLCANWIGKVAMDTLVEHLANTLLHALEDVIPGNLHQPKIYHTRTHQ